MARIVLLLIALALTGAGCVSVDGGSVEASWGLHASDGRGISDCSCTCPPIAKVRFRVVAAAGGEDLCAGRAACEFPCWAHHGATPFDIPAGDYELGLVPVGADGQDLTGPVELDSGVICVARSGVAPTLRRIFRGQPAQLNAMTVTADCAASCGGSDSTKVCTK
jgi:hypothetical protein